MTERQGALDLFTPLLAKGIRTGLDTMRAALVASGDPHLATPCAHVTGTNGKGSVTATLDAVLTASGVASGRYTSPHLHRFVERVCVRGEALDEGLAASLAEAIMGELDAGVLPHALSFFEATTLLAWRAFRDAGVSFACVEVGMGGAEDATNLCTPRVTVITRVAFDHEKFLGDTLGMIARAKAGILKPGVPCVLGPDLARPSAREARDVIESVAHAVGAPIVDAPTYTLREGEFELPWRGEPITLRPSLRGPWHAENLATAVAALEILAEGGAPITRESLARGVASVRWPGRMERIDDVLFDAAHNPDGVAALVAAIPSSLEGARVGAMVFGASRDKAIDAMLAALAAVVDPSRWYFAAAPMERAAEPEGLATLRGGEACTSPAEALARARLRCAPGEVTLVCGSIFLVAAVRAALLGITQDRPIAM
jgi:dihydrofolate synthase / folylpolyglutamate synthase